MMDAVLAFCLLFASAQWAAAGDSSPPSAASERTVFPDTSVIDPIAQFEPSGLRGFGEGPAVSCCDSQAVEAEGENSGDACRLYAAKVLGVSFANVRTSGLHPAAAQPGIPAAWNRPTSNNESLFTAALAGGVRVPLDVGAVRLECEGALRDNFNQVSNPMNQTSVNVQVNDNWTTLANVWRDVPLTRRLGAYAGGGVGAGGYSLDASGPGGSVALNQAAAFAWQAGGGAVWRYNSLIDLDMSYRFLDYGQINAHLTQLGAGSVGTISSNMSAGQLFFMLRIYDPFQWRKHLRSRDFYLPQ